MLAQGKRALLVGISTYDKKYEWSEINGTNDIDLVKSVLKGFSIVELRNEKATFNSICSELDRLAQNSRKGDLVYIHFSGHGQPVEDKDGDEEDGWDESFIPYDAGAYFQKGKYEGECHLLDDLLHVKLEKVRQKVGESGMVYVVMDACHAGQGFRGEIEDDSDAPERGSYVGFSESKIYRPRLARSQHYKLDARPGKSHIVMLEACRPEQLNREISVDGKYYGPLSYSIYKVLKDKRLSKDTSWCSQVLETFPKVIPSMSSQKMVIESSIK